MPDKVINWIVIMSDNTGMNIIAETFHEMLEEYRSLTVAHGSNRPVGSRVLRDGIELDLKGKTLSKLAWEYQAAVNIEIDRRTKNISDSYNERYSGEL